MDTRRRCGPSRITEERKARHLNSLAKSGAFTRRLAKHLGETNAAFLAEDVVRAAAKP